MQQEYTLHLDELAELEDESTFRDSDVRDRLVEKGFENPVIGSSREWMRCSPDDVRTAVTELQLGAPLSGTRHATFAMRSEQAAAVDKAADYFASIWREDKNAVRGSSGTPRCDSARRLRLTSWPSSWAR